jgi:hypothetical protein
MKLLLAAALAVGLAGQSGEALGYACNNNYYINSRHLVHSPSCDGMDGPGASASWRCMG